MNGNDYNGVIPGWVQELIVERAKRMGFRRQDIEDAQQEVVLEVLQFEFDAAKANGACLRTVLTSVIDRRLKTMRRSVRRYRHHLDQFEQSQPPDAQTYRTDKIHLKSDVREALLSLSPRDRALCRALGLGYTLTDLSARWKCSWHTLKRRAEQIRKHFAEIGLDGWLNG